MSGDRYRASERELSDSELEECIADLAEATAAKAEEYGFPNRQTREGAFLGTYLSVTETCKRCLSKPAKKELNEDKQPQ